MWCFLFFKKKINIFVPNYGKHKIKKHNILKEKIKLLKQEYKQKEEWYNKHDNRIRMLVDRNSLLNDKIKQLNYGKY